MTDQKDIARCRQLADLICHAANELAALDSDMADAVAALIGEIRLRYPEACAVSTDQDDADPKP